MYNSIVVLRGLEEDDDDLCTVMISISFRLIGRDVPLCAPPRK